MDLIPFRHLLHLAFSEKVRRLFNEISPKINAFLKHLNPGATPEECIRIFENENETVRRFYFRINLFASTSLSSLPKEVLQTIFDREFGQGHPLINEMMGLYKYLKGKVDLICKVVRSNPLLAAEAAEHAKLLKQLSTLIGIMIKAVNSDSPAVGQPLTPSSQRLNPEWTFRCYKTALRKSIQSLNRLITECTLYLPEALSFRDLIEPLNQINRGSSPHEIEETCASLQEELPRLDETIRLYNRILSEDSAGRRGSHPLEVHLAASLASVELLRNTCRHSLDLLQRYADLKAPRVASPVLSLSPAAASQPEAPAPAHFTALQPAPDRRASPPAPSAPARPKAPSPVERELPEEPLFRRGMTVHEVEKILTKRLGFRLVRHHGTSHAQFERELITGDSDEEDKEDRVVQRTTLAMHSRDIGPRTASELNKLATASKKP